MKKIIISFVVSSIALVFSCNSFAGMGVVYVPGTASGVVTNKVNRAYAGLKFTLDSNASNPEVVAGVRNISINSNGNTSGGDISISAKFLNGFEFSKLRAKLFSGQENLQGEVGGGYDFIKGFFAGVSGKSVYSTFGADYLFQSQNKFEPYVQVDTVNEKKPTETNTPGYCKYAISGNVAPGPC